MAFRSSTHLTSTCVFTPFKIRLQCLSSTRRDSSATLLPIHTSELGDLEEYQVPDLWPKSDVFSPPNICFSCEGQSHVRYSYAEKLTTLLYCGLCEEHITSQLTALNNHGKNCLCCTRSQTSYHLLIPRDDWLSLLSWTQSSLMTNSSLSLGRSSPVSLSEVEPTQELHPWIDTFSSVSKLFTIAFPNLTNKCLYDSLWISCASIPIFCPEISSPQLVSLLLPVSSYGLMYLWKM